MNKRSAAMMAMSLCLLLGALRMVDLLYLSDPAREKNGTPRK